MSGYFELIVDHDNLQIPVLFGIPKFHKNPVKMRYIAGAAKSTLKPLSILAYNVLSMLKTIFEATVTLRNKGLIPNVIFQ